MRERAYRAVLLALVLAAVAGSAKAADNLWFHVTVDEGQGAKVTVNLPLALAEKALPMLPWDENMHWNDRTRGHGELDFADLRELWAEVKNSPDMTFVTVEDNDERVKVWKAKDFVYVEVRGSNGSESVDVQIPIEVVDALVGKEEIDFKSAIEALARRGGGDLVTVRDKDDNVRVWIDEKPEARRALGEREETR
jgi:hypothetical protein